MADECLRCGSHHQIQRHHIQPRASGGSDDDENLVPLCRVCHDEIHTGVTEDEPAKYTDEEFWRWIYAYDGDENDPWETEFVCYRCGYEWEGKPLKERTATSISCAREACHSQAHVKIGELLIEAIDLKQLVAADDSLNYTGIRLELNDREKAILDGTATREIPTCGPQPVSRVLVKKSC